MGELQLSEAEFMVNTRVPTEVDVTLHKVDGDLDLLKLVKARPGRTSPWFVSTLAR